MDLIASDNIKEQKKAKILASALSSLVQCCVINITFRVEYTYILLLMTVPMMFYLYMCYTYPYILKENGPQFIELSLVLCKVMFMQS